MRRYVNLSYSLLAYFLSIYLSKAPNIFFPWPIVQADRIHATVRKHLVKDFRTKVEEGQDYLIENVMVGFNEGPFKLILNKHDLKVDKFPSQFMFLYLCLFSYARIYRTIELFY